MHTQSGLYSQRAHHIDSIAMQRTGETFEGENLFTNFVILQPPMKFSPQNFHIHLYASSLIFCEILPSYRSAKTFSLESFPLYAML